MGTAVSEVSGTVGEHGEFALVDRFVARLPTDPSPLGPGDDAAVLPAPLGRVVASTDSLVVGQHFRTDWSGPEDVGHKAAAQAIADVVAMGATPTGVLVALGLPPDLPAAWVDGLADGLRAECTRAGAKVLGGDVVRSPTLTVTMTAFGDLQGRTAVTRAGARPGDVLAVAGRLGWSAAGFAVLGRGFRSPVAVVAAHRRPEPLYEEGPRAALLGATAMCDVSDGLLRDAGHIAAASGVRVELRSDAFAVPARLRDVGSALGADPMDWILDGGEDHALLASFPADVELSGPWSVIGAIGAGAGVVLDGTPRAAAGYDHFR